MKITQEKVRSSIFLFSYSANPTQGLLLGSIIESTENISPGIFQYSKILITRYDIGHG